MRVVGASLLVATQTTDWITAISTLVLALFTIALVLVTGVVLRNAQRAFNAERLDAAEERKLTMRSIQTAEMTVGAQILASYRPVLIEVSPSGPIFPDMGARATASGDLMTLKLGTLEEEIDPRIVYVRLSTGGVVVSVPLRNVGPGLAIIDPKCVRVTGVEITATAHPVVHRPRVPPGETTRIDFEARYEPADVIPRLEDWAWWVEYRDYRGVQPTLALLRLGQQEPASGMWHVSEIVSTEPTDDTPGERAAS